ncbi:Arylsulfatase [Symmachiella macrocystis]|uniref:Arylsulfatase n=2 Tax=Symmachiella macrocystis TaxID=2527985 RepID=A0A5C6BID5_9PLAN|nr:Arylsulfatase [Symmachiella macrocystis]
MNTRGLSLPLESSLVSYQLEMLRQAALASLECHTTLNKWDGALVQNTPTRNILWICADDFSCEACQPYGNRIAQTPHINRLATESVRFDRAYCTAPLSTPSRQSFLTGKFPWSIGVTLSPTPLPDYELTIADRLRRHGYHTAAFGKTHYYADLKHRFDKAIDHRDHAEWLETHGESSLPPSTPNGKVLPDWRPFFDPAAVWLNSMVWPYAASDEQMYGTYVAQSAVEFLSKPPVEPFFAYVAFHETHSPFHFPVNFEYRCKPECVEPPEPRVEHSKIPEIFESLTWKEKQGIIASYHTCASYMDKNIGLILDALRKYKLVENTLVIFTSDHGYLLGQRGRFEKHCCYEPAVRVPFLLRVPGDTAGGAACDKLVSLVDIVPTLLDFCDIQIPRELPGRSLWPLVIGETSDWRRELISHYAYNEEACLVEEQWKLVYGTGACYWDDGYQLRNPVFGPKFELYDLKNDPDEVINLAETSKEQQRAMRMLESLEEAILKTHINQNAIASRGGSLFERLNACLAPPEILL